MQLTYYTKLTQHRAAGSRLAIELFVLRLALLGIQGVPLVQGGGPPHRAPRRLRRRRLRVRIMHARLGAIAAAPPARTREPSR